MVQFAPRCDGGNASCRHGDLQTVGHSGTSSTSAATIQRDFKVWVWVTLQFATHCGGGNASCRHGDLQTVRSLWHFFFVCSYDSMRLQILGLGHVAVCNSLSWCFILQYYLYHAHDLKCSRTSTTCRVML